METQKHKKVRKVQVIICKCGARFAGSIEPYCYTDIQWQRDLRKYVKQGCRVELLDSNSFSMGRCRCDEVDNSNDLTLFSQTPE